MQGTNEIADIISGYFMNNGQSGELDVRESIYVISDSADNRSRYSEIIGIAGFRVPQTASLEEAKICLETQTNLSAILLEIEDTSWEWEERLKIVETYCANRKIPLLLIIPITMVDAAMDEITYDNIEYIIIAEESAKLQTDLPAEIIISLPRRMERTKPGITEGRDEIDTHDLKKISADVERIARALNLLSSQSDDLIGYAAPRKLLVEPEGGSNVHDAPLNFKSQDAALHPIEYQQKSMVPENESRPIKANQVRNLIKARRLREQYFDAELFADPAWDMLLDLMAAQLENKRVSVSSLCIAASVPPTTALRWIKTMTEEKIFERKADTHDGRRIFIELSDQTTAAMIGFFGMIRRTSAMLV